MPGRVLTFGEFSNKYSDGNIEPANVEDMANAASNFEEAFDEETYDQPEIKPNRPIAGNYEMTPAGPGEEGAPKFSAENTEEMNAPQAEPITDEPEETEQETEDESEEKEEGNPEAGANPKKKVDEGFTLVKDFSKFISEDHGDYPSLFDEDEHDDYDEDDEDDETCRVCGEVPISNEYGVSCGCNM